MPSELNDVATDFFAALDAMDADRMMQAVAEDAQSVDEISRRWLRGGGEVDNYLRELMGAVSEVRTQLRDPEERVWGDTGLLTCWIDQDYTMNGTPQHISAPCGCRQSGSRLIGAAPRPPELASGRIGGWSCPSATGCCAASSS